MTLNTLFQSFIAVVKDELYEHFIRDRRHRDASIFFSLLDILRAEKLELSSHAVNECW